MTLKLALKEQLKRIVPMIIHWKQMLVLHVSLLLVMFQQVLSMIVLL